MKKVLRYVFISSLLLMIGLPVGGQVLNEQFNSGLPAGWVQTPTATWSLSSNLGVSGSACIITEEPNTTSVTNTIKTVTLNLSGITNPTVSFKGACTKNNFICPNIALFYDAGGGPQFMARWGSGFSSNTTYTISDGFDPTPPLDAQNVNWQNCSHTFTPTGNSVRLIFDAEMVNAGYVLLDSIVVTGKPVVTGIKNPGSENSVAVFPNPTANKKFRLTIDDFKYLVIYDQLGKNIPFGSQQRNANSFEIEVCSSTAGIYYLGIVTSENVTYKKIIIE